MTIGHDTHIYNTRHHDRVKRRLIIFDWDDTLFPSSWLQCVNGLEIVSGVPIEQGVRSKLNADQQAILHNIVHDISCLINKAKQNGHVLILTNSRDGWVNIACNVFYQHNFLEGVEVVSAQEWGNNYTHFDPRYWKTNFLKDYLQSHTDICEIINFGDSEYDHATMRDIKEHRMSLAIKNVKFLENPCVNELRKQLCLVKNDLFQLIFNTHITTFVNYNLHEYIKY